MAKAIRKKQTIGWALRVNRTGAKGSENWERVGYVFNSKWEAETFRKSNYSHISKYHLEGVRISAEPIAYVSNKAEAKEKV